MKIVLLLKQEIIILLFPAKHLPIFPEKWVKYEEVRAQT